MFNFDPNEVFATDLHTLFTEAELHDSFPIALDIVSSVLKHGTDGRAESRMEEFDRAGPGINTIPAPPVGSPECGAALLVFCFDEDSFDDRVREMIYHAAIDCPDTRLVVFVTSQWSPSVWKGKHENALAGLRAQKGIFIAVFGELLRVG